MLTTRQCASCSKRRIRPPLSRRGEPDRRQSDRSRPREGSGVARTTPIAPLDGPMWGVFGARLAPARRLSRMRHDLGPAMSLNVATRPGVALVLGMLCVAFGVLVYYEIDAAGDQARTAPIP